MSFDASRQSLSLGCAAARGAYLACSWTWCIGMFLPVLLIAEFGLAGWIAFTLPNVVGAAAMGLMLRREGAAQSLRERNVAATACFSYVTIAFQMFFVGWIAVDWLTIDLPAAPVDASTFIVALTTLVSNPLVVALLTAGAVYSVAAVLSAASLRTSSFVAVGVWVVSAALGAAALLMAGGDAWVNPGWRGLSDLTDLVWLAPVLVFGFALSPYLDLTFLRVRSETPGLTGDASFVIGFGALFPVMLLLTLSYAPGLLRSWWVSPLVIAHMLMQVSFTAGAHLGELRRHAWPRSGWARGVGMTAPILAALLPVALLDDELNRTAYRIAMGAFGLAFPAFVWIVVFPRLRSKLLGRAPLALFAVATLVATPMFWMGFVERRWWFLAPGIAAPVIAPLALRRARAARAARAESA